MVLVDKQVAAVGIHQVQGIAGGVHQVAVLIFDSLLFVHFPGQQGDFLLQFLVGRFSVHEGSRASHVINFFNFPAKMS